MYLAGRQSQREQNQKLISVTSLQTGHVGEWTMWLFSTLQLKQNTKLFLLFSPWGMKLKLKPAMVHYNSVNPCKEDDASLMDAWWTWIIELWRCCVYSATEMDNQGFLAVMQPLSILNTSCQNISEHIPVIMSLNWKLDPHSKRLKELNTQ